MDHQKLRQMGNTQSLLSAYFKAQEELHLEYLKDLESTLAAEIENNRNLPWRLDKPAFIHALRWAIRKLEETK